MDLTNLNEEQKEAVEYLNGPLLVLAGAGSGKTKVLTNRIAYLIENGISPFNILAITFTNKAAAEMKERVIKLIGGEAYNMQISTFHSFGLKIIRENNSYLGLDHNFAIFDVEDSITAIKRVLKRLDIDSNKFSPKAFHNKISSLKNDLVSSEDYKRFANTDFEKMVIDVYNEYEKEKINDNAVDFDDLLLLPIKLFKENKDILENYQERFRYILIDEYQDTNEAQYVLTKMLAKRFENICVVGDSDQAIYGFRGANFKNILNFEKDYKLCKTIILKKNYRSTRNILDTANSVIKNNNLRHPKELESVKGEGELVTYYRAKDGIDEINYIANEIEKISKDSSLDEIVIL
ncbi:MAG: UvrD-helicase domain-containing protein, partial [Bacilli bacterium]|nr:UvrD-helicase domain-containing protein [Bacilli bacterium]